MKAAPFAVAASLAFVASAAPVEPAPSGTPVLVELFTSEGCSSCPLADRLLAHLAADQPVAGALVVPLSLHVDYWNRLGWADPFSSAAFTQRQGAYAARFGSGGRLYTPQMVVDGGTEFVGSDERAARRAIEHASRDPRAFVRVLEDKPGSVRVTVAGSAAGADVFLAVVEDGLASDVTRGENAGKKLVHVAVARALRLLGRTDNAGRFDSAVPVPPGSGARRLIAFAQVRGLGRVLGTSVPADVPSPR